jgi:hypothetical protein
MDYEKLMRELRAERTKGAESDTAFARELADLPPPMVAEKVRQRRAARHAAMEARASGPLFELEHARRSLTASVPGLGGGVAAARRIAAVQREYNKSLRLPDSTTLARMTRSELMRQATAATTPAVVAEYLRELEYRAEGDDAAKTDAVLLGRHLAAVVDDDPQVQRSIALFHDYGRYVDSINATLRAVRDGSSDDGVRWQAYESMRELKDAGITAAIRTESDGSASVHVVRGAGEEPTPEPEKWVSTPDR